MLLRVNSIEKIDKSEEDIVWKKVLQIKKN